MGNIKTFEQFLDLFPAGPRKKTSTGWLVLCPVHNDHEPSLHISLDNDQILLNCHAGCLTENILKAVNHEMGDLFLDGNEHKPTEQIIATYDYQDENGQLLYQVVRYQPKSFRQRRPDGNGGWVWNLDGIRRVLYHLPDLLLAPKVYLTEGEKDCDGLWNLGLVATTSPGGASNWRDEYAHYLENKTVVIIPDKDEAGYKYAHQVSTSLQGKAEVRVIILPGEDVKDTSDWLAKGSGVDELKTLAVSRMWWKKESAYPTL